MLLPKGGFGEHVVDRAVIQMRQLLGRRDLVGDIPRLLGVEQVAAIEQHIVRPDDGIQLAVVEVEDVPLEVHRRDVVGLVLRILGPLPYPFTASRLYPSRVCGSFRPRMRDATTVRRICAVPPPMVNIRASRAMRSSGRLRE